MFCCGDVTDGMGGSSHCVGRGLVRGWGWGLGPAEMLFWPNCIFF